MDEIQDLLTHKFPGQSGIHADYFVLIGKERVS